MKKYTQENIGEHVDDFVNKIIVFKACFDDKTEQSMTYIVSFIGFSGPTQSIKYNTFNITTNEKSSYDIPIKDFLTLMNEGIWTDGYYRYEILQTDTPEIS